MGRKLDNYAIEACARSAHEVNRQFRNCLLDKVDESRGPWEGLSEEARVIAKQSVINIAEHDMNNKQLHDAWVSAKRAAGWSYGPTKDIEKKEHPCLVEWDKLPFEQQAKDDLWISTVKNFLGALSRIPGQ